MSKSKGSTKVIQQKLEGDKRDKGCREKYFLAFSFLAEMPPLFKKELYEFFDCDIKRAWEADEKDILQYKYGGGKVPKNYFKEKREIDPDKVYKEISAQGIKFITCEDALYPAPLKEIPDYPLLLYYEGSIESCNFDKALAVVGSRKASDSAKCTLENIIGGLGNTDVLIVSGLAYGIDATAHKAALENNLNTIGVIASGPDIEYPSVNKDLYKKIKEGKGAVITEYPPGSPPISHHFPSRNRIVTGCSKGTLVAEAALRSGAMISANLTLEQNRDLMCMPGLISNPNTQGIYKLLKDGAHLVTGTQDILDILGWEFKFEQEAQKVQGLSGDEKTVLDLISREISNVENIQTHSGFDTARLMVCLTALELKSLIKQIRGQYIISG